LTKLLQKQNNAVFAPQWRWNVGKIWLWVVFTGSMTQA